ncbi:dynamin GTPase, putative [Glarea lozoyensis ATCC 20868]|uniref:Dynamin GTPase, putative n=1 Tax=Glarea lozoyensis (strain ATCC 20868 / MF5171) TaxID=1116229 RepID=S3DLH0_GLAL2|nr:dynamin GTPase, putative [Glarea lozoyensis ATCC 20868]EPE32891.1 dynamin GTPase, putative [Glarea lozoyensis ATCC 20868]
MNSFLKLARNESESHQFKLGWHVLKNRDPRSLALSTVERDAAEMSFFSKPPWSSFDDQSCLGIDKLRLRLSRVLHERIASSLPDIIEEIRTETAKSEAELQKLGTDRSSRKSKETYLVGVAQHFQMLAQSAVDGTWSDHFDPFFQNPYGEDGYRKRLRAVVQNLNDQFSDLMYSRGRRWILAAEGEVTGRPFAMNSSVNTSPNKTNQTPFNVYPGIDQFAASEKITREEFMLKIEHLSSATRGRELSGAFNHNTIGELFREQSQRWTKLAEHHVETVWNAVKFFLEAAFEALADPRTLNAIMIDIVDPMMADKRIQARKKLEEILVPHTKLHPISYNSKLLKSVHDAKFKRELERIQQEASLLIQASKSRNLSEEDLESIVQDSANYTQDDLGDKFGSSDILDYTNAYYEISLNTFVDNVATLVIESCLISNLSDVFPAAKIPLMDDELLDRLASDSDEIITQRRKLEAKLTCFRDSLKICQKNLIHIPRDLRRSGGTQNKPKTPNPASESKPTSNSVPVINSPNTTLGSTGAKKRTHPPKSVPDKFPGFNTVTPPPPFSFASPNKESDHPKNDTWAGSGLFSNLPQTSKSPGGKENGQNPTPGTLFRGINLASSPSPQKPAGFGGFGAFASSGSDANGTSKSSVDWSKVGSAKVGKPFSFNDLPKTTDS